MYHNLVGLALFVALCLTTSSCNDSTHESVGENMITLKVTFPDNQETDSPHADVRNGVPVPGDTDEKEIETLKFFVYKDNGSTLETYKSLTINPDGTSSDPMWDKQTNSLRLIVTPGSKQIYCIANWAATATTEMPVIDDTNANNVTDLKSKTRIHTGVTPTNPPVMTGELAVNLSGSEERLDIKLTRQIARVQLTFKLSDELAAIGMANIKIEGVRFYNLAGTSHVFPQTSIAQVNGGKWHQTGYSGTSLQVAATEAVYPTKYYIPEYAPYNLLESNATTMVIKANYHGQPVYYTVVIDPTKSSTAYPVHNAFTIERNHTYMCNITIQGIGNTSEPVFTRGTEIPVSSTGITCELEIK